MKDLAAPPDFSDQTDVEKIGSIAKLAEAIAGDPVTAAVLLSFALAATSAKIGEEPDDCVERVRDIFADAILQRQLLGGRA